MFIHNLSDFFHTAAVFIYVNAPIIIAVLFVLIVLNFVRGRMVAARRRNAMKLRAVVTKPAVHQNTFDPFAEIKF